MPWEDLVQTRVAVPLGMASLGFGFPPGPLIGHNEDGEPSQEASDPLWHSVAYAAHATIDDWRKFLGIHLGALRGLNGQGEKIGLSDEGLLRIQTPVSPAVEGEGFDGPEGPEGYGLGWKTQWNPCPDGEESVAVPTGCLWHYGTNFYFNSGQYLRGEDGLMIMVASNSGSMLVRLAVRSAIESVLEILSTQEPLP